MALTLTKQLISLRTKKKKAEMIGRQKKEADADFKQLQGRILARIDAMPDDEKVESIRAGGTLFSVVEKIKGQIEDRGEYVRWALANDAGIAEFLERWRPSDEPGDTFEDELFEAIMHTELVTYKEIADRMNQQARAHVDDGQPLPPGLTFRPDPYISQRAG